MAPLNLPRLGWLLAVFAGACLLATSCIYDPDHRCGPNQHLGENSTCLCDDGLVPQGQTCVPCRDHEIWQSGVCACVDGFTRASGDGKACVSGGPGVGCDPSATTTGCEGTEFATCRDRGGSVGYCTTTCAADGDCPHGFACDAMATPSTCKSAAFGEGDPCTTAEDCVGKDASYCESALVHVCLVAGCSVDSPLTCSEGWSCCDVRPLGLNMTLCVPEGKCPTAP